jgi:ABC-2 type transport system ATP-binding protein
MRALVKRLAERGLTVLLSSHHMDEVEEICDNVTIMSRGSVAFHGSIAELRSMAPDPGYALETDDTQLAAALGDRHPAITVVPGLDARAGLVVTGPREEVSAYVADLVRANIHLLGFTQTQTPLEALFFMLTDQPRELNEPLETVR